MKRTMVLFGLRLRVWAMPMARAAKNVTDADINALSAYVAAGSPAADL